MKDRDGDIERPKIYSERDDHQSWYHQNVSSRYELWAIGSRKNGASELYGPRGRKPKKGVVMKKKKGYLMVLVFVCVASLVVPPCSYSQGSQPPVFKAEELEQILAPVALYPDSLLTQILMASTYPLEIVQADRWAKQNKDMKGDALAKALEAQPWDPSVKSLVNFPQVLAMMSEKLDWTQKVGDAFLAQQKDVMGTIQKLRHKAQESGNLKTTKEQVVKVEQEVIIIEPASPQVVYVPTYNPTVVYGAWAYPAYPPYPVYPPGYVGTAAAFTFAAGVAVGAAWGYAWGHSNWHGGDVNVNVNQNTNINNNIDRSKYQGKGQGQGQWQHDAGHRGGVAYKDQGTAQKYNKGTGGEAAKSRESYRGKDGQGAGGTSSSLQSRCPSGTIVADRQVRGNCRWWWQASPSTMESGGQQNAFGGADKGSNAKMESNRGQSSRESMSAQSSQRGGGGSGGGGGGSRGGGGSGGGGRSGGGGGGRR